MKSSNEDNKDESMEREQDASASDLVILGAGDSGARMIRLLVGMHREIRGVYDERDTAAGIIEAKRHNIRYYVGWPDGLDRLLGECASNPEKSHCFFLVAEHERFVAVVLKKYASYSRANWTLLKKAEDFPRSFNEEDLRAAMKKCEAKK